MSFPSRPRRKASRIILVLFLVIHGAVIGELAWWVGHQPIHLPEERRTATMGGPWFVPNPPPIPLSQVLGSEMTHWIHKLTLDSMRGPVEANYAREAPNPNHLDPIPLVSKNSFKLFVADGVKVESDQEHLERILLAWMRRKRELVEIQELNKPVFVVIAEASATTNGSLTGEASSPASAVPDGDGPALEVDTKIERIAPTLPKRVTVIVNSETVAATGP